MIHSTNRGEQSYFYNYNYIITNANILNAFDFISKKGININDSYIKNLIKNKIVNEIFDYRKPENLKSSTIVDSFEYEGEIYVLLGYLDPFKMKDYGVKYGDKYLYELKEFEDILNEQRDYKDILIDFLKLFYYKRDETLNEKDLWKLSFFGLGLEIDINIFDDDYNSIKEIFEENPNLWEIFKNFLNMKMEESFNRLNLRLKYNFLIFKKINNKLEPIIKYFKELNQSHTKLLKIVLSKIQELLPNNRYFYNLKQNEDNYKNYLSYIKTDEAFIIHVEYINPYYSAQFKSFNYYKMILFEDLIDFSDMTNKKNESLLTNYEGRKYYRETNIREQDGGDIIEIINKSEWSNIESDEYILNTNIKVLFCNTDERHIVHSIIYKKNDRNEIYYYYLKIIPNLNDYRQNIQKFINIINNINDSNISYNLDNTKIYNIIENNLFGYKIFVKKIDISSKYFNFNENGIIKENSILNDSFIFSRFLKNIPGFYYYINGELYRNILRQENITINENIFKNYLSYYPNKMITVLKSRINSNNPKETFIFEKKNYIFGVRYWGRKNNYKYVGYLFDKKFKEEVVKNRNNKGELIKKGDNCITNLIQADNEQIEVIKYFLDCTLNKLIEIGEGKNKEDFIINLNRKNPLEYYNIHFHFYPKEKIINVNKKRNLEANIYSRTIHYDYTKNINMNLDSIVYKSNDYNKKKNLFGFSDLLFPEIILIILQNNN